MRFKNKAGDHTDTDTILTDELHAAGIPTFQETSDHWSDSIAKLMREASGEVKTSVRGVLHGWEFERAWYYWVCSGPGIPLEDAERLHAAHGEAVRAGGDCTGPSPRSKYHGLACGMYHVDDSDGLRALAECIKGIVERAAC